MDKTVIPLENVQIASPCHAQWEAMEGKGNCRFCLTCGKNVYNLSDMARFDAEELITQKEGDICVRYHQRADGTILTQDCPVGVRKLRQAALAPFAPIAAGVAALLAYSMWVFGARTPDFNNSGVSLRNIQPFKAIMDVVSPPPPVSMGIVGFAPPSQTHVPRVSPDDAESEDVKLAVAQPLPSTSEPKV